MSVNIMTPQGLKKVAGDMDSLEKGVPGGVATLDGNAKIPVGQLPEIVSKKYKMSTSLDSPGWYRIFTLPSFVEAQFTLSLIRSWGYATGENFSVNIAISQYAGENNNGIYNVSFTQNNRVVSYNNILTGVRIVSDNVNWKPIHIDVRYDGTVMNPLIAQLDNYIMVCVVPGSEPISSIEKDPEILETQHAYEWHPDKFGMVADYAIADGNGNDIVNTYMTKNLGCKYITNPENNGYKEGDLVNLTKGGTEENPRRISFVPWSCKYAFSGGVYQLDIPLRPVPLDVQLIDATLIIPLDHVVHPLIRIKYAERSTVKATGRCGVFINSFYNSTFVNLNIYGTCVGQGGTLKNCNVSIVTHSKDIFVLDETHGTFYTPAGAVTV